MISDFITHLFLFIISIFSNFLSALAGGGAGLIQLPAIIFLGLPFAKGLATHKIASVALGLGASFRHLQQRNLNAFICILILGCGLPGVVIGTQIVLFISSKVATICLGLLIILLSIFSRKLQVNTNSYSNNIINTVDLFKGCIGIFVIGILNGSLTSGTGLFLTFWLIKWFQISFTSAVAYTLILVGIAWNLTGSILLGVSSEVQWIWLPSLILGSLIGGYLGAHYSIIKGDKLVKSTFRVITLITGVSLLMKVFVN